MTVDAGYEQVAAFLYKEAALLDDNDLDGWLALFESDGVYWIPSQPRQSDPLQTASIVYEDTAVLRLRIERMKHPRAHALQPSPRTLHSISNIVVTAASEAELAVESALIVVAHRGDRQRLYAGRVRHSLRRNAQDRQSLRIAQKRVDLIDCDAAHEVLSILL